MALYSYQAFSKDGKKTTGYIDAPNIQSVRDHITKLGMYPIKIDLTSEISIPWYKKILRQKISLKDKIFFTKQLSVLLKSGVPLVQALELLSEQTAGALQRIVISLKDNIKEGKSLADALMQFPSVFDTIYIQLVKAGEASGKLELILERLTDYLSRQAEIRSKIRGALTYPIIQLIVILLVVILLLTTVVPEIAGILQKQNIVLPLATRILISISDFFTSYYLIILLTIIILGSLFVYWKRTPKGSYTFDAIKLKLPIVGYFSRMGAIVQFSRTLGTLIEGGVNLAESLNIVVQVVDNKVLVKALTEAKENIIKQGKIAQYLKQTGLFPSLAIYLINTGEQSGQLDAMLLTVAKTYEDELNDYASTLTTLLNPIMMVIMGGIVGFIVLAILSAVGEAGNAASKMAGE